MLAEGSSETRVSFYPTRWRTSLKTIILINHNAWAIQCFWYEQNWGSFPGVKRPVCEVSHSPPRSAEIKNEWSCTSTPTTCLHGVERDNFTSFEQNNWYIKHLHSTRYSSSCCIFQHIIKSTVTVISKIHNLHPRTSSCTRLEFIYLQVILQRFFLLMLRFP